MLYLCGEGGVEDGCEDGEQGRGEHGDTAAGHGEEEASIRRGQGH